MLVLVVFCSESILHLVRDAIENPTLSITKVDTNLQVRSNVIMRVEYRVQ